VKIENPLAFRYILQDDVYLINDDKAYFAHLPVTEIIPETPSLSFNYLGGNKKNFLVITHYADATSMHELHLKALESTLKRLSFEMDDVALFNIAGDAEIEFDILADFFKPQKLLILGKEALPVGRETFTFNAITTANKCKTLYTFSFSQMMNNNEYKKVFWEQIKQL
jgi:hypothetical protein